MFKIKWQTSLANGCFRKWWYPQNTPKWSFLVGKRMVVGYHHFRNPPNGTCFFVVVCCWPPKISSQNRFCLFCCEFYPPWNSWILKVGLFSFLGKAFRAMLFLGSELVYLPRTKLSSIFEGQPSKTRPFSIITRVIWVCVWKLRKQAYHIMEFSSLLPPKRVWHFQVVCRGFIIENHEIEVVNTKKHGYLSSANAIALYWWDLTVCDFLMLGY